MDRSIVIMILLLTYGKPSISEPACSKFHYEEQTLEKMIRQEIKVEKMKSDFESTEQRVINALEELKAERNAFDKDMKKKEEDIENLKKSMDEELERMKRNNQDTVDDFSTEMQKIKESTSTPIIAFKADKAVDKVLGNNKVIVLSNIIFSHGDAYNKDSGVFVAPISGIYLFTAQICIDSNAWCYIGIVVNDNTVTKTAIGEKIWWKCYSIDAITPVEKGNEVTFRCTSNCEGSKNLAGGLYAESSFSGVLIHKNV